MRSVIPIGVKRMDAFFLLFVVNLGMQFAYVETFRYENRSRIERFA